MNREQVIEKISIYLREIDSVHALWLEGSDANGHLDEYSDIDICLDIDEEAVDDVFSGIKNLFDVEGEHEIPSRDERQLVFHVKGTSKYLWVDFTAYIHGKSNNTFIEGDKIDVCKVLFDKDGIIKYREFDAGDCADEREYWKKESQYRFSQINRVEKYCLRGQFPEAFVYYQKYVVDPLVFTLRAKYTPTKIYYYMIHISQHIPAFEIEKLNKILQVASTDDILRNLPAAQLWYDELTK